MAEANAVALHTEVSGPIDAPALVLVHSLGTDGSLWDEQARALGERYRIVRVDLRGHGRSPAPPGPYALSQLALDVLAAADAAGVHRFHCAGISLGGAIALWLAVHRPERIDRLVLANTAARIGTEPLWNERIRAVRELGMDGLCDAVLARWLSPERAARAPELAARIARIFRATDPEGYAACCAALAAADLRAGAATVRSPTLILAGSLDVSTPVADARALHAAIPGSELEVLEGAAHLSNLDRPAAFTARVAAFLDAKR